MTKRECITVVRVVWHHAVGMGIGIREIGANLLGAAAHAHRVVPCHAGLKEIGNVVLGKVAKLGTLISQLLGGHVSHLLAPAFGREGAGSQVQSCTINILDFWLCECLLKCHIRVHRDGNLAFLAFFGGNHEHAVGCRATIKRCRISALEHVDALDVVGVDERKRIAAFRAVGIGESTAIRPAGGCIAHLIGHRHTVDNNERAVVTHHRLVAANENLRRAAGAACRLRNRHARHLARQGIHEVGILHFHQVIALYHLRSIGERCLFALDTHSGNHNFLQLLRAEFELNINWSAVPNHLHRFVADSRNLQLRAFGNIHNREISVEVGSSALIVRAHHKNRGADERVAHLVFHNASRCGGLLRLRSNRFCLYAYSIGCRHQ